MQQVCTAWRQVCSELTAPIELDFGWATTKPSYPPVNPLTDAGLRGALGRFKAVGSVNLTSCKEVTDAGLAMIGEGYPNLKSLNLDSCTQITDAGLARIGEGCPNLQLKY